MNVVLPDQPSMDTNSTTPLCLRSSTCIHLHPSNNISTHLGECCSTLRDSWLCHYVPAGNEWHVYHRHCQRKILCLTTYFNRSSTTDTPWTGINSSTTFVPSNSVKVLSTESLMNVHDKCGTVQGNEALKTTSHVIVPTGAAMEMRSVTKECN